MRKILKYQFEIADVVEVEMPYNTHILSVQLQNDKPTIWAIADTEQIGLAKRRFHVYGTGHDFPFNPGLLTHLASLQMKNGLVWHIFE